MRKTLIKLFATMCIVTLAFVACSSDSDDSSDTTTTTTEAAAQGKSLVEIAQGNPDFSTLVELVTNAGLAETLSAGNYTVFAPTNAAFEALDAGVLDGIKANPDLLAAVLTYHAIPEQIISSTDLEDGQVLTAANGKPLTVGVTDAGVTLTDENGNTINVVQADLEASNGIVHVIDGVFIPEV